MSRTTSTHYHGIELEPLGPYTVEDGQDKTTQRGSGPVSVTEDNDEGSSSRKDRTGRRV